MDHDKDILEKHLLEFDDSKPFPKRRNDLGSQRIMNYNASVYQRLRSHKRPLVPVIAFVLYFGLEKPWEKARSI